MAAARPMRNEGPVRTPVRGLLRICDATWTARHLVGVSGQHMPPPSLSDTEEEEEDGSNSSDDFADDPYAHLQRRAAHHGHHNAGVRTGSASRFGAAVLAEEEDDAEGGGGAAADLRVDEQDGDDGLGLSPRRRRRSPAGSAGRPAHRQPKFQRTDPCWVTVQDGIMGEEALEVELKTPYFLSTPTVPCKMIKERDGVEDLVVTRANGHVEVGKGRGIHSGCRVWQHKARKWPRRPWTVGAP